MSHDHEYVPFVVITIRSFPHSHKSNTTGVTNEADNAYLSEVPELTIGFKWGSSFSIFSLIFGIIKLLSVWRVFLLTIVLSLLLRFVVSDSSFGILQLF